MEGSHRGSVGEYPISVCCASFKDKKGNKILWKNSAGQGEGTSSRKNRGRREI